MIKVNRHAKPEILVNHANDWRDTYLVAIEALDADKTNSDKKSAKEKAEANYAHDSVRKQLKEMFESKCAFCESHISHISYPHIEHFRPKQKYPNLCFEWDNLLLACGVCNGAGYKGTKFPEASDGGPFINPVEENPDDFFEFVIDPATFIAEVIPKTQRGQITEIEIGLNRSDLVKHRSKAVMNIFQLASAASNGDSDCRIQLIRNCQPDWEYAAFARSIADRFGIAWKT